MFPLNHATKEQIENFDKLLAANDFEKLKNYIIGELDLDNFVYHSPNMANSTVNNPYLQKTYSDDWVNHYKQEGYVYLDPVVKRGMKAILPFDWNETFTDDTKVLKFLNDADSHKIGNHGFSIPLMNENTGIRALFSISKQTNSQKWQMQKQKIISDLMIFSHYYHIKNIELNMKSNDNEKPIHLSKRELEIVSWASEGKTKLDIAAILRLSPSTVDFHLEQVRSKLNALNTTHAIAILLRKHYLH